MSNLTLVIGNKNYSSWSLRPWFFMKQNNLDFDEKWVSLYTPNTDAELKAYGSDYKVPVLIDDDLVVWDSLAILEYLSDQYLNGAGWPAAQAARATARSISNEMHSSFANVRHELPMNCRKVFKEVPLSSNAEREIERIKTLWQHCRLKYGQDGEWLFGDFSIADAMFAPVALRFYGYSIPLEGYEQEYVQTVLTQPHIQDWMEAGRKEQVIIAEAEKDI